MRDLTVSLIQAELTWEDPGANREAFAKRIAELPDKTDLIVMPEMFTTGFSMTAASLAEPPGGATQQWMQSIARQRDCALAGSVVTADGRGDGAGDEDAVFNRMLFVTPDTCEHYDKRHLFRMAGEHKTYAAGDQRVVVSWREWRIKLEVCYDLRFPVFSRNRNDYDLLINGANWPEKRVAHWRALLQARAIENQACVVGVNRVGKDANGYNYSGDSLAFDARGDCLADLGHEPQSATVTFSGEALLTYRERFPFQIDADEFEL
ncbi:MAG: amidohydrolase [Pseudomonadota bacterium]